MKIHVFKGPVNEESDEHFGFMISSTEGYFDVNKRWDISFIAFNYCLSIEI